MAGEVLLPKPQQSLGTSVQELGFGSFGSQRPVSEISSSLNAQFSPKQISSADSMSVSPQNARSQVQISHAESLFGIYFSARICACACMHVC